MEDFKKYFKDHWQALTMLGCALILVIVASGLNIRNIGRNSMARGVEQACIEESVSRDECRKMVLAAKQGKLEDLLQVEQKKLAEMKAYVAYRTALPVGTPFLSLQDYTTEQEAKKNGDQVLSLWVPGWQFRLFMKSLEKQ